MYKYLLLFLWFGLVAWSVDGQQTPYNNSRTKILLLQSNQNIYQLDTLTIIPEFVKVIDFSTKKTLASSTFFIQNNNLILSNPEKLIRQNIKTIQVNYRVFSFNLTEKYTRIDSTKIKPTTQGEEYIGFTINPYKEDEDIIQFKGLDYNGSFSRGLSFGNAQNLVLNSSFNLQLAGEIGDDIEILAAITDNNIPLQPEGNTQQLQEFDRIFIQLKKEENTLIAGDYELQRPNSYFMNYFKKLQGATLSNTLELFDDGILKSRASVAIARGKFARNILNTQEGNQGPYRLQGNQGERFIIALAGTEKVYFDGELLTRGLEEDYIIDYNRADITFTNKRLITKDSRIIVEFEYSDQQYLRSMYAFDTELKYKKWRLHLNGFSEQDSRNSGGLQDLDSLQQVLLANIGDDIENALAPSIQEVEEFNEFRIQYEMIDTFVLINNESRVFEIIKFSTSPNLAKYTATFTNVGLGQGNYELDLNNAENGRVYYWVAPNPDGSPNGTYEPVIRLVAPAQKQLFSAGADYKISKNASIQTEVALSRNDVNRFSSVGDDDDYGLAAYAGYLQEIPLKKDWKIQTNLNYEFTQDRFQALNPYRKSEFTRDWNLANNRNENLNNTRENEQIARAEISIAKNKWGSVAYQFSNFLRGNIYTGFRHHTKALFNRNGFQLKGQVNWLNVDSDLENSRFIRPNIDLSKTFKKLGNIKIGAFGEQEKNQRFAPQTDTLNANSFYFNAYKVYLETPKDKKINFGVNFRKRDDFAPIQKVFAQSTTADEFNLHGSWTASKASRLSWNFTYRSLQILDENLTNIDPQNSSLGRLDYQLNLWKGAVRSTTNYEIGSGQEARIAYNYLPVNAGDGVYFWDENLDFNGDGVPQINEIREEAYEGEGNIIRVTIYTDEFIRTNNVTFNESLQTNLRRIFKQQKGFKHFLGKFSTQSTLRVVRRIREADGISPYNPFQLNIPDTALVAINSSIRNILFFNRGHQKYDIQLGQTASRNKIVLTSGFQERQVSEQFFRTRWNISRKVSTQFEIKQGKNSNNSQFFNNQDYKIDFVSIEPQLTVQPSNQFRTILKYEFKNSQNDSPLAEKATKHDFSLETTYNRTTATSIRSSLSFVNVSYNGEPNTPLEFTILETLKKGRNYLWNISLDRRLSKNILMSISYNGRKTGSANTVHIGSAQVRATF